MGGKCESGRWFQFGVECGFGCWGSLWILGGEDEEKGEGEELTEASVEEDVVGGDNALYLWDVVVLNAPVGGYFVSASDVQEGLRASLRVVVYIDMGGGMMAAMRKA